MSEAKRNTSVAYASAAPLPADYIEYIVQDQQERFSIPLHEGLPSPSFYELRQQVYREVLQVAEKDRLTTAWLARKLTELTPHDIEVRRQTIYDLRDANVVTFDERGHPGFHSAAALLLARLYSPLLQKWRPVVMEENAPSWFVWIELVPGSEPLMCTIPFDEEELVMGGARCKLVHLLSPKEVVPGTKVLLSEKVPVPSSAFLYTPWEGALQEQGWYKVPGGTARFLGKVTEADLSRWNPLMRPFGLSEEQAPDIFEQAKILVLQMLARPRLMHEYETILWRKPQP